MTDKRKALVAELEELMGYKAQLDNLSSEQLEMFATSLKNARIKKAASKKAPVIQDLACKLLCEVALKFEGKEYGHSYETILAEIRKQYPAARTQKASLQWYKTQIGKGEPGFENYGKLPAARLS